MQKGIKYKAKLISPKLTEAIKNSGLSYGEISKITGIPKSSIHRYAQGDGKTIPSDAVRLIAQAVGVSHSWLIGSDEVESYIPSSSQRTVFAMEGDGTETASVRDDNYEELSDLMALLRDMPPEKLKKIAEFVEMMK